MLAELTDDQANRLWWRLVRAMAACSDEIDALELAPAAVRDMLYGRDCLESYRAMRDELAELADNDVRRTVASWRNLLAGNDQEGTPQWHDSLPAAPSPWLIQNLMAMRISLVRTSRRLMPRR